MNEGLLAHIPKSEISTSHRSLFLVEAKGTYYNHNEPSLIYSFYDSKMMYILSLYVCVCVYVCIYISTTIALKERQGITARLRRITECLMTF